MIPRIPLYVIDVSILLLSACARSSHDPSLVPQTETITLGMTQEQVRASWGNPSRILHASPTTLPRSCGMISTLTTVCWMAGCTDLHQDPPRDSTPATEHSVSLSPLPDSFHHIVPFLRQFIIDIRSPLLIITPKFVTLYMSRGQWYTRRSQLKGENLMGTRAMIAVVALGILWSGALTAVHAQQPQIPTLQVCNITKVSGNALVRIVSRSDATHSGTFKVSVELTCDPRGATGYPAGTLTITSISMTDSTIQGDITNLTVEQITSTGRASPTVYLNGRCRTAQVRGCRFWLMLADNKPGTQEGTPDVIGFLVFNALGQRMAYGTGPVAEGDITVAPTSN